MKIAILGAGGYVGARLFIDLKNSFEVVGTYHENKLFPELLQLDITQRGDIDQILNQIKPEIVIHVANNPSSKWCDENPEKAVLLNEQSTGYLVEAANARSVKIIYISTMGAIESDNLYQRTKSNSEKIIRQANTDFLILRPSVGIGLSPNTTAPSFFNQLLSCIKQNTPTEIDTSLKFQPVHLNHISQVILSCIKNNIWNQTIPISIAESKSKYEIAFDLLSQFGIKVVPVDNHRTPFNGVNDIDEQLTKLHLPVWTYSTLINKTISEIKTSS